jgi:hypothetical protein
MGLQLRHKNKIYGSYKKLTNIIICTVVGQEFERVTDIKYCRLILTEDNVNCREVRTVRATEEINELT